MSPILSVRGLTVCYPNADQPAVDGVGFDLEPGATIAVVGESGSGKSTVALALSRLLNPAVSIRADALTFEGQDLLGLRREALRRLRARRIAMIFQSPFGSWNPSRTIGAQLVDGLRAAGLWPDRRERLLELLKRVGLDDPERRLGDYPHRFSGGMLQRAMIAGALVTEPSLLVADEPTSALDATVQAEILEILDELRKEQNLALMLISHDLGVVARVAQHTLVLYRGQVVESGPTAALYRHAGHPYTQGLLAAVPRLEGPRKTPLPAMPQGTATRGGCVFASRCPRAEDLCRTSAPSPRHLNGTNVACHFAEDVRREPIWRW
ncbi:ABC transporter ATP-binding protein [Acrocarpospora pleiomorpha]|uniref:ABC transporter ATP-binding protein n=1 Tax=Acrocarpospora pleiomorpha TaxID=90975 RepID=A0A5M3XWM5_9ACTN|nr:ABC transporter ATP-binding protein [Acrocarpospora pleiomorpha]GES25366.1 ABC transporter ATP-binding protein [Acrocarpospora pleiomorpha]